MQQAACVFITDLAHVRIGQLQTVCQIVAHGIAAGVWVIYGLSIIFSALLSEPPSPVLTGSAAILGAVTHIGMARAWAGEGVK